jgi:hypothetical protein
VSFLAYAAVAGECGQDCSTAIRDALAWYDRWVAVLDKHDVTCSVSAYEKELHVYCAPDQIQMEGVTGERGVAFRNISKTPLDPVNARAEYERTHTNLTSPLISTALTFRRDQLNAAYNPSASLSRRYLERTQAHMREIASGLQEATSQPLAILYPIASHGDPFYHVYVVRANRVDSVWEFQVKSNEVAEYAHWTYDRAHKNVPRKAAFNLNDRARWFTSEVFDNRK